MAGCYENRAKSRTGGNGYSPLNWPWPFLRWFMVAIVVAALGLATWLLALQSSLGSSRAPGANGGGS